MEPTDSFVANTGATGGAQAVAQYLSFRMDTEVFAVDVAKVREVLDRTGITRVPQTPGYMKGIINLRGAVVPVVDLRLRFGLGETSHTVNSCIIVMEVEIAGEKVIIGTLADSVQEVFEMSAAEITAPPKLGNRISTSFISGIGSKDDAFIIILDIDRIFAETDLDTLVD